MPTHKKTKMFCWQHVEIQTMHTVSKTIFAIIMFQRALL